ncbi:UNVERIFIED_CONTAM: PASTA domain-containing protein, partial [Salmonella enterica subsp. enterica serovar Weltevreden]
AKALKLPVKTDASDEAYVTRNTVDSSKVVLQCINLESLLKKGIVPNLNGLSAKDALYLLEHSGFHVKLMGMGSVEKQSLEAGHKLN